MDQPVQAGAVGWLSQVREMDWRGVGELLPGYFAQVQAVRIFGEESLEGTTRGPNALQLQRRLY